MVRRNVRPLVLDSCVWVAYLHTEDSQHKKACALLNGSQVPIRVPEYVLVEVVTVLSQKKQRQQAVAFMERVLSDADVFMPAHDVAHETAKQFRAKENAKLSFADCALVVLQQTCEVMTFDRALSRALTTRR